MKTKTPKYRFLIVEQQTAPERGPYPATYKHVAQLGDGSVMRAYQYRRALDEGTLMQGIWGDAHPVRIRAQHTKGEDILTLEDVERIGRELHTRETEG